jgi:hypothetical protein
MQDEKNDGDHDDDVNQAAGDMKHEEPAQPGNEQNDG